MTEERVHTFGNYLREKYHQWWGREVGHMNRPSQADFAVLLGVPTSNLSTWMQDQKEPSDKYVDIIAESLVRHRLAKNSMEVYEAAGRPPRMPKDRKFGFLASIWNRLPEHLQNELYERAKNEVNEEGNGNTQHS